MKKIASFCAGICLVGFLFGCVSDAKHATPPKSFADVGTNVNRVNLTNTLDPALLRPPATLFSLGPGDQIDIEIIGTPLSRTLTTVGPDGKIYYQLLPGIDVWGLTLAQTQELLEEGLGKYLNQPHLSVTLRAVASKHVWLLGRLNKPGIYPMTGPMTL